MTTPSYLVTKRFWTDTAERVVSTAAQAAGAAFGGGALFNAVSGGDWGSIPWQEALGITALAAGLAFFKALAAGKVGDPSTASLTKGTDSEPATLEGPSYESPQPTL